MNHKAGDERVRKVMDLVPSDWDTGPMVLSTELRNFLKSIVDEGTNIDSGGMDGTADLWPVIGGIEYLITIRRSNKQLLKDGKEPPACGTAA